MQSYSKEAVIFLAVLALATDVSIFCSGIRQNSCPSNELQDFWQSPLRFDSAIHHHLIPKGFMLLAVGASAGQTPANTNPSSRVLFWLRLQVVSLRQPLPGTARESR